MIRNASPKGSIGKTFGFVYLGEFISDDLARHSMTCTLWLAARHRRGGMDFWSAAVFFVMCGMIGSGRAARAQMASSAVMQSLRGSTARCRKPAARQKMALNTPRTTSRPMMKMIRMIHPIAFSMKYPR
jgi:hypothetical protein